MNVLSLFDGISCGRLALQKAGINVNKYYASEVDKFAIKVSKNNFPEIIQLGDVRNIENVSDIDLLIGGSPCQSFSFSGKRNGMTTKDNIEITSLKQYLTLKKDNFEFDGQSYLFWEYIRLLKSIKPKYFLLENVKMSNKWKNVITENIGVKPIQINSNLVSAQNRNRLYWTNIENIEQPQDRNIKLCDILEHSIKSDNNEWYQKRISLKRRNVIQSIYDNKSATLQTQAVFNTLLKEYKRYLTPIECERLQTLPDNYTDCISKTQRYKCIGNGWTIDVISHIFKHMKL